MSLLRARVAVGAVTSTLLLCLTAASAHAATTNPFACRASVARVESPLPTVEPFVANPGSAPCVTDTQGLNTASVFNVSNGIVLAGPVGAFTYSSTQAPTTVGPVPPSAAALASINGVTIPLGGTNKLEIVGPAYAEASYACVNGTLQAHSDSTLDLIYLNGQKIALGTPGQQTTIPLGPISITLNETDQTPTSITQRILDVKIPGLLDVVVGEASVGVTAADPCSGSSGGGGGGGGNPCPPGSTFDPVHDVCVVSGTTIVVGVPFGGPTGGTVMALSVARKRYHSKCLYGRGPAYAIVGTNGNDRITGTHRSERILGLGGNDRIAGQGGNDCIDGGAGRDRIWGGNGNDRIYGGTGNDRISLQNGNGHVWGGAGNDRIFLGNGRDWVWGGSGNDRISVGRGNDHVFGGSGKDTISTGDGNDHVYGGRGNDKIYVGNGRDRVFGGSGNDRIFAPSAVTYVNCGSGQNLAYVNTFAMGYASAHGCQVVRQLRSKRLK